VWRVDRAGRLARHAGEPTPRTALRAPARHAPSVGSGSSSTPPLGRGPGRRGRRAGSSRPTRRRSIAAARLVRVEAQRPARAVPDADRTWLGSVIANPVLGHRQHPRYRSGVIETDRVARNVGEPFGDPIGDRLDECVRDRGHLPGDWNRLEQCPFAKSRASQPIRAGFLGRPRERLAHAVPRLRGESVVSAARTARTRQLAQPASEIPCRLAKPNA
jgi:hypothetical protein